MQNAHGDVVALTNGAGEITKTYAYDPFGAEKNIDLADNNPFRYCSEYYDKGIDKIYLRARTYDPAMGRFTQQDPACDGFNWYVYCYNNPLKYLDTNGQVPYEQFGTLREAVADWAWNYYGASYYVRFEFASLIYKDTDSEGNTFYSYTYGVVGSPHNVEARDANKFLPEGVKAFAYVHSHPVGTKISPADKDYTKTSGLDTYAVVPSKKANVVNVQKYEISGGGIISGEYINEMPVATLDKKRKIELRQRFVFSWRDHAEYLCHANLVDCSTAEWPHEWR